MEEEKIKLASFNETSGDSGKDSSGGDDSNPDCVKSLLHLGNTMVSSPKFTSENSIGSRSDLVSSSNGSGTPANMSEINIGQTGSASPFAELNSFRYGRELR